MKLVTREAMRVEGGRVVVERVTEQEVESVGELGWCIAELMGHRRLGAYVREVTIAGAGMLRLDVPAGAAGEPAATQYVPPASVYALTPVTEAMARAVAAHNRPEPVARWELPPAPVAAPRIGPDRWRGADANAALDALDDDDQDEETDDGDDEQPGFA